MRNSCLTQQLAFAVFAIAIAMMSSDSCIASGGSWGGSLGGGSLGSRGFGGGSWGARGGFRTPVRNFFAYRQPVRNQFRGFGSRGNGWGSAGGYGSGGYASAGNGSAGYTSGGFGSAGGGYGSAGAGRGYGSAGYSYYASTASYAPASTSFVSAPSSYTPSMYSSPSIISSPISNCSGCISGTTGVPINSNMISPSTIPYSESTVYGDSSAPVLNSTEPYYGEGSVIPSDGSGSSVDESGVRGFETPPTPEPANGNDETTMRRNRDAILNVNVPLDAKVYVNDRLTKTGGTSRSYVSRKLASNKDYTFNVEAIVERDGKKVSLKRQVAIRAGRSHSVNFDFDSPVETRLTVKVPENASIKLCGNDTLAKGSVRNFKTKLMPGKVWQNYNIEVSFDKDGEPVTQKRTLTIEAGGRYVVDFESNKDLYASK